jgi:hypothetical protein
MPFVTDNVGVGHGCQRDRRREGGGSTMKRLLIAIATAFAFAAFAAAAASADAFTFSGPTTATVDQSLTYSGQLVGYTDPLAVYVYNTTCDVSNTMPPEEAIATLPATPDSTGLYSVVFTPSATGTYSLWAGVNTGGTWGTWPWSDCVDLTVAAAPVVVPAVPSAEIASSYLCWNREMVNPVAYIDKTADQMWKTGNYLEPQAILGNVAGGTNLGAYHLVCNAPATMHQTDLGLGGSGEVYSAEVMAAYHAEHSGGNDLNVYHIWK